MREAIQICGFLNENSDVCLGFSKTRGTKGSGIGDKIAYKFCYALKSCDALQKDIITSIEDVKIFMEDLDVDRISDMVSNIIRLPLLQYTKTQCENYNIPMQKLQTKPFWDGETNQWERYNDYPQLIVNGERKLLVPKKLVSDSNNFTWFNFLQHYIYNSLIDKNLKEESSLVMRRKDGAKYVTKKSIKEDLEKNFVIDKKFCEKFAIENPELYRLFKEEIINKYNVSIEDENETKSLGLNFSVSEKEKTVNSNIKSAFLKGNTKEHILTFYENSESANFINKDKVIKIKFKVVVNPPSYATYETKFRLLPSPYQARLYDLSSLFAGKIHACLCRNWKSKVKGRDFYDYVFFLSIGTKVNLQNLKAKLVQSNFIQEDYDLTIKNLKALLNERFANMDFEKVKEDVLPFIKNKSKLDIWSKEFFIEITKRIASI